MKEGVVVIPNVNNIGYLQNAIQSIKASFPFELLVIDNGSTDGSYEWLLSRKINTVRHNTNFGVVYANNEAMDYAFSKDKYLFVIHNDVVLHKDCLNNMYEALETTDYDKVFALEYLMTKPSTSLTETFNNLGYKYSIGNTGNIISGSDYIGYSGVEPSGGINFTVRGIKKSVVDKVGYVDINFFPAYFDDNDYGLRCKLGGVKFGLVPSAVYQHFWSRSIHEGGVRSLNDANFEKNKRFYISKWGGPPGKETKLTNELIKIMRTREEDYDLIKGRLAK